jgi:hypothetical protein
MTVVTGYTAWSLDLFQIRALPFRQRADAFVTLYSRWRAIASVELSPVEDVRFCD